MNSKRQIARFCPETWTKEDIEKVLENKTERNLETGCLLWTGGKRKNSGCASGDYGAFHLGNNKYSTAHRMAYIAEHGNIPEGLDVLHTCDTPLCCEKQHLYAGTKSDNAKDRRDRQGINVKKGQKGFISK
jgi:hypothetical protein